MYETGEYGKEILNGLKKLLSEKENEKLRLENEENQLREQIGYQMALSNLDEKLYGGGRSLSQQETINKATYALREFNENEENIRNKMHLPDEIKKLKEMIEEMEKIEQ